MKLDTYVCRPIAPIEAIQHTRDNTNELCKYLIERGYKTEIEESWGNKSIVVNVGYAIVNTYDYIIFKKDDICIVDPREFESIYMPLCEGGVS